MKNRIIEEQKETWDELIFSESDRPIIRAGGANGLILGIPVYLLLMGVVLKTISASSILTNSAISIVALVGTVLLVKVYMRYASRIAISQNEIRITCSLDSVTIPFHEVDYVRVRCNPLWGITVLKVKEKKRLLARRFRFATPFVKSEYVQNVVPRLRKMMTDHNIKLL